MTDLSTLAGRLTDKTGREIKVGDVLKVDHFIHYLRRRRCYMFKQVIGIREWPSGIKALRISHLDTTDVEYLQILDGRQLPAYEIVQGAHDDFYDRPPRPLPPIKTPPNA